MDLSNFPLRLQKAYLRNGIPARYLLAKKLKQAYRKIHSLNIANFSSGNAYLRKLPRFLQARPSFLLSIMLIAVTSCQWISNDEEEIAGVPVARVYDSYLYKNDLEETLPQGMSAKDSTQFVNSYINVWAKNKLMVYKAEYNLPAQAKNFEARIEKYRNDLLKHSYLQRYTRENLDTTVEDSTRLKYYQEHKNDFGLRENILRLRYIIIPEEAPHLEEIRQLFLSNDAADRSKLRNYTLSYAREFGLQDSAWISFARFNDIIPVQVKDQESFLAENSVLEFNKKELLYLVEIRDYKLKGSVAPLAYISEVIKNVVINQRRLALVDRLEKNLIDDAYQKNEFETFKP